MVAVCVGYRGCWKGSLSCVYLWCGLIFVVEREGANKRGKLYLSVGWTEFLEGREGASRSW